MKNIFLTVFFFLLFSSYVLGQDPVSTSLKAKVGKDRFAGLHFDFHATLKDTTIGRTFTSEMIDSLLSLVKPDFIQVDCKGHPGISSYPTKVGHAPPHFDKDIMKIWREVTLKHNVPLFVHYSGVWDTEAIKKNPEWARINSNGSRDKNANSLLGGYPEGLLQPQLVELAKDYQLDGAWIDGDCWVLRGDYSPKVVEAFKAETGISWAPRKEKDADYFEWMEFNRKLFRKYIANYVKVAHQANPAFKITSNWSFSSMMPERVDVPVDFLSGDVAGSNSLYSSAFESRCLAYQGKPWDLMSWSFAWKNEQKSTKSVAQLKQEGAEVLAMGGGFQTYWQQNEDGTPEPYQFAKMAELIKFTKDRKVFCYQGNVIPQVGLLYSSYAWKRIPEAGLYSAHSQGPMKGILNLLMDSQLPVDILMDHHVSGRIQNYPVLVLPEWVNIDPQQKEELLKYVSNGGNLIVAGASAVDDFSVPLGIKQSEGFVKDTMVFAGIADQMLLLKTNFRSVEPALGTEAIGSRYRQDDFRFRLKAPLATVRNYGKGKIAGIYMDMGDFYTKNKNLVMPLLIEQILKRMAVSLISKVSGSNNVHQVMTEKNGKHYLHLINSSGPHDNPNVMVYNEVPHLSNLTVRVKASKAPTSVKLQPQNTPIKFTYKQGEIIIPIASVDIYSILEISGKIN